MPTFVDAHEASINNLLSNKLEAYRVPDYQRPYSWEVTQWEDLLRDVRDLGENESHFLGSFVVIPEGAYKHGLNYFEIVDGQQRFTTISIILMVIRDILQKKSAENQIAKDINETFLHVRELGKPMQSKLILSETDQVEYEKLLNAKLQTINRDHKLFKCYKFYTEKLSAETFLLESFLNDLLDKVSTVHINAFSLLNAFKLFETMNDRGLDLSAVDLIKNYVFKSLVADKRMFDEAKDYWSDMYNTVKDIEPVKFIRRYVLATYTSVVSERKLYEEVKQKLDTFERQNVLEFVKQLQYYSEIYKNIYTAKTGDSDIDAKLRDLNDIKVAPSYTLLLRLFNLLIENRLNKGQILDILHTIEIFHVRWGVTGQATNDLDRIYNSITNEMISKNDIPKFIRDQLISYADAITDDIFGQYFKSADFNPSDSRTKYLLWRLETFSNATTLNPDNVNTEHIMPKTLSGEWIKQLLDEKGIQDENDVIINHEKSMNKIGNLCLLEQRWNKSMKNSVFSKKANGTDKYKGYKGSSFNLTKSIAQNYNSWAFVQIEQRTADLAKQAQQIWHW